jgi:ferritin-like metal-binding protein YciE
MPTYTPTKDTGATAQPNPVLYVDPEARVTEDMLTALMPSEGINTVFVADLLSGMLTHERCGVHLYRTVASRSHNPMLKARYMQFGEETEHHVEVLERLVTRMGGNPSYISAQARAVEGMDSKLVESTYIGTGSLDLLTAEMAMLDAVFLAETMCHTNWQLLAKLTGALPEGATRDAMKAAVDEVEDQEDKHLEWAHDTKGRLVQMQAKSSLATTVGLKTEEMVAKIKGWFSD